MALALSLKLDLEDVLYVSAKTSHTQRRPKTEALDRDFKQGLRRAFYGDQYANSEPPLPLPRSKRPADFSPDAALYHDAVARLDACALSEEERRTRILRLSACARARAQQRRLEPHRSRKRSRAGRGDGGGVRQFLGTRGSHHAEDTGVEVSSASLVPPLYIGRKEKNYTFSLYCKSFNRITKKISKFLSLSCLPEGNFIFIGLILFPLKITS